MAGRVVPCARCAWHGHSHDRRRPMVTLVDTLKAGMRRDQPSPAASARRVRWAVPRRVCRALPRRQPDRPSSVARNLSRASWAAVVSWWSELGKKSAGDSGAAAANRLRTLALTKMSFPAHWNSSWLPSRETCRTRLLPCPGPHPSGSRPSSPAGKAMVRRFAAGQVPMGYAGVRPVSSSLMSHSFRAAASSRAAADGSRRWRLT